jgi:protein SCO1/2
VTRRSKAKGYAEKRDINSKRWYLLTGDREQIYTPKETPVEENMGNEKTVDDFLHTENSFVPVDKRITNIRGIYNGLNRTSVQQLITDLKHKTEKTNNHRT